MKLFNQLINLEDAQKIVMENIKQIDKVEKIDVEQGYNRVLANDIAANFDNPPFDRAAMDGYALNANDTLNITDKKPIIFEVIDKVYAGKKTDKKIGKYQCIEISTGACIPACTNTVVKFEDVEKIDENKIRLNSVLKPYNNISPKGEDIKKNEVVMKKGEFLTPAKIGVITSLGIKYIDVYAKPVVGIISTGEEIIELNSRLDFGQVYDVNSFTLKGLVIDNGCIPKRYNIVNDNFEDIKNILNEMLRDDICIVSGGSSVGEKDLLADVIKSMNGKILFHGVKIKPGKPLLFGMIDDKPIFGMPGYPTSCLLSGYVFLVPAIRKYARLDYSQIAIVLKLDKTLKVKGERKKLVTVKIEDDKVIPVYKESGTITSMSKADGYIEIPENINILRKGEDVIVNIF